MKTIIFSLLIVFSTGQAFAEPIVSSEKLQLTDSTRLYRALLSLGHTAEQDKDDASLFIHRTSFSSSDRAFSISCENRIKGVDLGTECEIAIDSSLSQEATTVIAIGVVGGVIVTTISAEKDIQAMKRSIASPLGYFQSTETVQAQLPNGKTGTFPKLRVDCKTSATSCQITLFP